jgi:D-alanine-D-alanine ligase
MDALVDRLGVPLVVKPARGGSALGCSVVHAVHQLPSALVGCFAYGEDALVERHVSGREVAVSVVDTGDGPVALPAVEIVADGGMYDYQARYTAGATEFFVPARLSAAERDAAAAAAVRAHEVLGLLDLSRTDMIVDADGRPWFLDMNVTPGMTETSLLPQSVAAAGLDLGELVRDLLVQAVERGR